MCGAWLVALILAGNVPRLKKLIAVALFLLTTLLALTIPGSTLLHPDGGGLQFAQVALMIWFIFETFKAGVP